MRRGWKVAALLLGLIAVVVFVAALVLDPFSLKLHRSRPSFEAIGTSVLQTHRAVGSGHWAWVRLPADQAWASDGGEVVVGDLEGHRFVLFVEYWPNDVDYDVWSGYLYSPDDVDPVNGAILTEGSRIAPRWWRGQPSAKYLAGG